MEELTRGNRSPTPAISGGRGRAGDARDRGVGSVGRGLGGLARRLHDATDQLLGGRECLADALVHALRELAREAKQTGGALLGEVDALIDERAELDARVLED